MSETITRFAVKHESSDCYYTGNLTRFSANIYNAKLYKEKPEIGELDKVIMVSITYKELPYEVK